MTTEPEPRNTATPDEETHFENKILSSRIYPAFFPLQRSESVANIGCGEGPQAVVYARQFGAMFGVDINHKRLATSQRFIRHHEVDRYIPVCSDVEALPFRSGRFRKALAIDILEHVKHPITLCCEIHRILDDEGELLITFPVMFERFMNTLSLIRRIIKGKKSKEESGVWNPDDHHHQHAIRDWIRMIESAGFRFERSRATTLFPPLYILGIPRFWFRSRVIHRIDNALCGVPFLQSWGQTLLCVFRKTAGSC